MDNIIKEKRLISLNSNNATQYLNGNVYLSNIMFDFKSILQADPSILWVEMGIESAQIPITFYNIDITNNTFIYVVDAVTYTITVTPGSYNYNSFISQLSSLFLIHGHVFTNTLNRATGILSLSLLSGGISWSSILPCSMYYIIGLNFNTSYTVTSNTFTCPNLFNLLGQKKLKIYSSNLAIDSYDSVGNQTNNLICTMSVNQPYFGMLLYNNLDGVYGHSKTKYLSTIDIQIKDELNNYINFNGINWTMTIVLILYKKMVINIDTIVTTTEHK